MATSIKKVFASVSAVAIIGTAFVGGQSAFAASSTGITGVPLTWTAPAAGNFADVELNGKIQTTSADIDNFTVTDARGTGDGWNVTVSATQLEDKVAGLTIPKGSIAITKPKVTAQAGASEADLITPVGGAIDVDTPLKVLSAPKEGGMGKFDVTFEEPALTLTLNPRDVKAGSYTSTIEVTITTGP